jgi:hypothetical protein
MSTLSELTKRLQDFCTLNSLPQQSADELLHHEKVTDEQYVWLTEYISEWDEAQGRELGE